MQVKFLENKSINMTYDCPPIGYYALDNDDTKPVVWDHCREQFLGKMSPGMPGFFFSHYDKRSNDVAYFICHFEQIVSLSGRNMTFSCFSKTERKNIIWIVPSKFWLSCLMRRSLLTLLLRCSLNFECAQRNFESCLFGDYPECKLIRETRKAVIRFMFGFTEYIGQLPHVSTSDSSNLIRHGWHSEFSNATELDVKSKLALPVGCISVNKFGFDFLWN